ncbi:MAG: hypothetical protein F6J93_32120 [Oscillatoria sp. SIO1A7]|nr:hypothetical protein [Oscillatoria sp. SIO1A7]
MGCFAPETSHQFENRYMTQGGKESDAAYAAALLFHYNFERGGYTAEELIAEWRKDYPTPWLRWAVIEALYQGRYKAISVKHILCTWRRRGQPRYHFNLEFETLVCGSLPKSLDEDRGDRGDRSDRPTNKISPYSFKDSLREASGQKNRSGQQIEQSRIEQKAPRLSTESLPSSLPQSKIESKTEYLPKNSGKPEDNLSQILSDEIIPDPWLEPVVSEPPSDRSTSQSASKTASQSTSKTASQSGKPIEGDRSVAEISAPASSEAKQTDNGSGEDQPKSSIGQFTPKLESSEVYAKLKATIRRNPFQD